MKGVGRLAGPQKRPTPDAHSCPGEPRADPWFPRPPARAAVRQCLKLPIRSRVLGVVGATQGAAEGDEEGARPQPGDQLIVLDHPARGGEDVVLACLLL